MSKIKTLIFDMYGVIIEETYRTDGHFGVGKCT